MAGPLYKLSWLRMAACSSSRSASYLELQPSVLYFIYRLAIEVEGGPKDLIGRTGAAFGIKEDEDEDE